MYPSLTDKTFTHEELVEHFTLTVADKRLIRRFRSPIHQLGFAVLLKSYLYLGYIADTRNEIPLEIIDHVGQQLCVDSQSFSNYHWLNRTFERDVALIRESMCFSEYSDEVGNEIKELAIAESLNNSDREHLSYFVVNQFRYKRVELPSKSSFQRLLSSVISKFAKYCHRLINERIDYELREKLRQFLYDEESEGLFNGLKIGCRRFSKRSFTAELKKQKLIQSFEVTDNQFTGIPKELLLKFKKRISREDISKVREHPEGYRYSYLLSYLYFRQKEITDNIIKLFLDMMRKIYKRTEHEMSDYLVRNARQVYNKRKILQDLTFAIVENPTGLIERDILSRVELSTLENLAEEFYNNAPHEYDRHRVEILSSRYNHSYRSVIKSFLDQLSFRSNYPRHNSLLNALILVKRYFSSPIQYYPLDVDIEEDLLKGHWSTTVKEIDDNGRERIVKYNFELCVLEQLEKFLRCKEIWVEGAGLFRNPDLDLPQDWEDRHSYYYEILNLPEDMNVFVEGLKRLLKQSLEQANNYFSMERSDDVYIYRLGNQGFFRVPPIEKRDSRPILKEIHKKVNERWGVHNLLDLLVYADRQLNFRQYFPSLGDREELTHEQQRERLILNLFSLGTNTDLKLLHSGTNPGCGYDDLLYYRQHYMHQDGIRQAVSALTNLILERRDPLVWGECTACASDGKQVESYDQNLMAGSNPHYRNRGIIVYWHVDTNSLCIYSQIKSINSSEVINMIEGIIRHDTNMKIERNYTDTHGQSEVAFAFCHLLGIKLMPRFKRIKEQKLSFLDKDFLAEVPALNGVLERKPIDWELILEQYDEMIKYVIALKEQIGSPEAILRRFSSSNESNRTYKAFAELGKVIKTIFLCQYLTDLETRVEVHDGLNIVEHWNSVNSFISYGHGSKLASNDTDKLEMRVLSLHLLQNVLILANTTMIDKVIIENGFLDQMEEEDHRSLTPLYKSNINPYGSFKLDFDKVFLLEVA
jgi:TnpA family transposase